MLSAEQLGAFFNEIPDTYTYGGETISVGKYWLVDLDIDELSTRPSLALYVVRSSYIPSFGSYITVTTIDIAVFAVDTDTYRGEPLVADIASQLIERINSPAFSRNLSSYGILSARVVGTAQMNETLRNASVIYKYVVSVEVHAVTP